MAAHGADALSTDHASQRPVGFQGGAENDHGGSIESPAGRHIESPAGGDERLGRDWRLWVQSANSQTYGSGLVAVTPVRTAADLWDAWDRGVAPAAHHVLNPHQRLVAMGGEVVALALFDERCRPEWEDPRCDGEVRVIPAQTTPRGSEQSSPRRHGAAVVDMTRECMLFVVGDACPEARRCAGIRITRGRGQVGARCEVWLLDPSGDVDEGAKRVTAADVSRTLGRVLAMQGMQVVTSVRDGQSG